MADENYKDVEQWEAEMANPDAFNAMQDATASEADGWAAKDDFPFTDEQLIDMLKYGGVAYGAYQLGKYWKQGADPSPPDVARARIRLAEYARSLPENTQARLSQASEVGKKAPGVYSSRAELDKAITKQTGVENTKKDAHGNNLKTSDVRWMGKADRVGQKEKLYNDGKNTFKFPANTPVEEVRRRIKEFYVTQERLKMREATGSKAEKSPATDIKGRIEERNRKSVQNIMKEKGMKSQKSGGWSSSGRGAYGGAAPWGDGGMTGPGKPKKGTRGSY